jgi:acyl transferase domain-containing protein
MQTAITQPAMLTMDTRIYKLLAEYGFAPDMVMGHSLGEYAALIAAGIMPFADALEASAARGAEMTKVSMDDNGWMAAVMAPLEVVEATLKEVDGYAVAANINSYNQAVVGGASKAVEQAIGLFEKKGFRAMRIPVSHAFHTKIVAPASKPLRKVLDRLRIQPPKLPLVANVTGDIYPTTVEGIKDILELQIASPVQWVKGLETMYARACAPLSRLAPSVRSRASSTTCWAASPTSGRCSPTTPRTVKSRASTRRCAGCMPPAMGWRGEGRGARGEV